MGTTSDLAELIAAARAWTAQDPDPETRAELASLADHATTDREAAADLADRFAGRLEFGTAGLRGALGAGPRRMNRVVVAQAAAGLATYLRQRPVEGRSGVVIGYDARHGSETFARDTAEIMRGAGVPAYLLPRPLPTPVLAYAIRPLRCAAGVMVTASHNPPRDNGYKVYLGDGSQIVPPADTDIAAAIGSVGPVAELPRAQDYATLDEAVVDDYVAAVAALPAPGGPRDIGFAYTALHGVGASVVRAVLDRTGFGPCHETAEQIAPDPDFPTVAFPNPEEPGAMDLALATADRAGAELAIANDPDADRLAVAVPSVHGWRLLSGDEVGALLADQALRQGLAGTYVTTIVSSSLLGRMAAAQGRPYAETLTGFKWISRAEGLVFGYEEALGYCLAPAIVRDKDGISALVRLLELAAELKAAGRTLVDRLDEIAERFGLHATDQLSARFDDVTLIADAMRRLRAEPPATLGGLSVDTVDDLAAGSATLPPTEGLRLRLADSARVVVRPSGTEPKLKCYLEVVVPVSAGAASDPEADSAGAADSPGAASDRVDAARIAAAGRLDAIRSDLATALGL